MAKPVVMTQEMAKRLLNRSLWPEVDAALEAIASGEVRMAVRCGCDDNFDLATDPRCFGCHGTGWRIVGDEHD